VGEMVELYAIFCSNLVPKGKSWVGEDWRDVEDGRRVWRRKIERVSVETGDYVGFGDRDGRV